MLEDSIVYFRFLLGLLNLPLEIISKDVYNYGHYHTLTITWLIGEVQDTPSVLAIYSLPAEVSSCVRMNE